ncbi:MAG: polysaccharide pyruvyl transferase family protein [Clostridia bacterium]|nr:polysaccharide pyruvyl transferase family protein [Clostridia bacterium]
MKIRTITCHDVYNAGASLQAYALCAYLNGEGHDARIIHYKPDYLSGHFSLWGIANPKYDRPGVRLLYRLVKLPGRLTRRLGRRKRRYDRFRRQYLPLTRRCSGYDDLKNDPPEADVYIAGSDQIWNTSFPNGHDPAFYLAFAPEGKVRASYAASFAADKADPACADEQAARIRALDYVSVREKTGLDILDELGIPGARTVMDPVFLCSADAWRGLIPSNLKKGRKPYLLVYDFDGSAEIRKAARELADRYGLDIYSVFQKKGVDRYVGSLGPREFIGYIDGAAYVLSNSFHATAFSLILHKPFMAFDRREKLNSRMRDLISLAGLSDRTSADDPIDWSAVDSRLSACINDSKSFLKQVTSHD